MKLIIAGGRDLFVSQNFIHEVYNHFNITDVAAASPEEIVSGGASGVDRCGEAFAANFSIPVKTFPAEWHILGPKAGPVRNAQMAEYADALLLIWNGESRGSANMKFQMQRLKKPVYEVILRRS